MPYPGAWPPAQCNLEEHDGRQPRERGTGHRTQRRRPCWQGTTGPKEQHQSVWWVRAAASTVPTDGTPEHANAADANATDADAADADAADADATTAAASPDATAVWRIRDADAILSASSGATICKQHAAGALHVTVRGG